MNSSPASVAEGKGLAYLGSRAIWDGSREFGLETPRSLCAALGNPQDKIKTIHVAGTNGKGSVCAIIASILRAAQNRVGQFTSPHLVDPTERCLIDSVPCAPARFDSALEAVKDAADANNLNPSFFEISAAASFVEFARSEVDYAVVEVGLGGRLDATNVIRKPEASVITSIGLDHTHVLGDSLELIAKEKAGILKQGVPLFVADLAQEAHLAIESVAKERGVSVHAVDESDRKIVGDSNFYLKGRHQIANASLAVSVARYLGIDSAAIQQGLECARWPARLECFGSNKVGLASVLLDAAHNEDGIRSVLTYLENEGKGDLNFSSLVFLIGVLERKDWNTTAKLLRQFRDTSGVPVSFVATSCGSRTSVPPVELAAELGGADSFEDASEALAFARSKQTVGSMVVIAGSSYLAGALRPLLTDKAFSTWDDSIFSLP